MQILEIGRMAKVTGSTAELESLSKELTLWRKQHNQEDKSQTCYEQQDPSTLLVPRSHPTVLASRPRKLSRDQWKKFSGFSMISSLREGQKELAESFLTSLDKDTPFGGIISAPTGLGKTVLGIEIAARLKMPVLVVVPRAVLIEQWKERLLQHTNLKANDIGVIRQNQCEFSGQKVSIGLVHSLAQRTYSHQVRNHFGLTIFDEVHTLGAETFSRVASKFESAVRLGLSATVSRKDGMANLFLWHIGPIVSSTTQHHVKPKIVQVRYYNAGTGHEGVYWNGKLILPRYLNRLASLPSRNLFLVELLQALYGKGHHTLLLSDRLSMLDTIQQQLSKEIGRDKVGLFTSVEKDLDKQILLGTYGSADMGADIPRLTALVLATPRIDVVQAIGRVLRQGTPVVYDIVDTASSVMQGWAHARMRLYRQKTWNEIIVKEYRT